jgi:hypothetical protein
MAETTEDSSDGYNPYLGKLLQIDPKQVGGNLSLAELGRKAIGAENAEYQRKLNEVEDARKAMLATLQDRKSRWDPALLSMAAGFLAPTRSGSFGESLGQAVGNYTKAQAAEDTRAAEMAKMRYELQRSGLADEQKMAELGLSLASKLTPKMTKEQLQVQAEGLDPNTPAGRQRLMVLQFLSSATPEAKEFFYSTGQLPGGMGAPPPAAPTGALAAATQAPVTPPVGGLAQATAEPEPPPSAAPVATSPVPTGYGAYIRQKQLEAHATPEMKEFAAMTGMGLTDPGFAAAFKSYRNDKDLYPVAARMGLDPTKPADAKAIRAEMQRDEFRKSNPEVAKALATFGGDPLNPADLQKAQRMLTGERTLTNQADLKKYLSSFGGDPNNAEDMRRAASMLAADIRLGQERDRTSIAAQRTQMARTQQEIRENTRNGNFAATAATARELGVPLAPENRYARGDLTPKERSEQYRADVNASRTWIEKNIDPHVNTVDQDLASLQRARALNEKAITGNLSYGIPVVETFAKAMSGNRAALQDFDSLSALSAKENRIPGDSNVSNLDVNMMKLGTFSSDKLPSVNKIIIDFKIAQRQRDRDYYTYMNNYASVNGLVGAHAQSEWRKYLNANPITTRDPKTGDVSLNKNRLTPEQYFSMPVVKVGADGKEIK